MHSMVTLAVQTALDCTGDVPHGSATSLPPPMLRCGDPIRSAILAVVETGRDQVGDAAQLFERPSYLDRVTKRFPYVLVPCLVVNGVGGLNSGLTGLQAAWAAVSTGYAATAFATLLTLLVALVPARQRQVSRSSAHGRLP